MCKIEFDKKYPNFWKKLPIFPNCVPTIPHCPKVYISVNFQLIYITNVKDFFSLNFQIISTYVQCPIVFQLTKNLSCDNTF